MAYNTKTLKKKAIEVIKKNAYIYLIGISKPCFYDHFKLN